MCKVTLFVFAMWSFLGNIFSSLFGLGAERIVNSRLSGKEKEQNIFNAKEAALQRDFARDERLAAQSFNAEQAALQRDFAHSEAQNQMAFQERMDSSLYQRRVADMEAAGINPALAVGGVPGASTAGASGAGVAASSSPVSGSAASGSAQIQGLSSVLELLGLKKQLALLDSQKAKTDSETEVNKTEAEKNRATTEGQRLANEWNPKLWQSNLDINDRTMTKLETEVKSIIESTEGQRLANEWNPKLWQNELDNGEVNRASTIVGIALMQQQIETLKSEQYLNNENAKLKEFEKGLIIAQTTLASENAKNVSYDSFAKAWENGFMSAYGYKPNGNALGMLTTGLQSLGGKAKNWLIKTFNPDNIHTHDPKAGPVMAPRD